MIENKRRRRIGYETSNANSVRGDGRRAKHFINRARRAADRASLQNLLKDTEAAEDYTSPTHGVGMRSYRYKRARSMIVERMLFARLDTPFDETAKQIRSQFVKRDHRTYLLLEPLRDLEQEGSYIFPGSATIHHEDGNIFVGSELFIDEDGILRLKTREDLPKVDDEALLEPHKEALAKWIGAYEIVRDLQDNLLWAIKHVTQYDYFTYTDYKVVRPFDKTDKRIFSTFPEAVQKLLISPYYG